MVGFSAKEVSNALASSNQQELQDMKNVMMEFQTFLKKFEVFPNCLYLAFLSSVHEHRGNTEVSVGIFFPIEPE
jgi:hypothetical protein